MKKLNEIINEQLSKEEEEKQEAEALAVMLSKAKAGVFFYLEEVDGLPMVRAASTGDIRVKSEMEWNLVTSCLREMPEYLEFIFDAAITVFHEKNPGIDLFAPDGIAKPGPMPIEKWLGIDHNVSQEEFESFPPPKQDYYLDLYYKYFTSFQ